METHHRVCTNCVMDTTDSAITFDENGICDHCNTYYIKIERPWKKQLNDTSALDELAKRIRTSAEGKDFDCIIGVSGGIDSSYLAYMAKEQMGLRPLVFHVDAGWNSKEAVTNIERLVDALDLDLYTEVIDWDEMRDLQLAFFRSGVPHVDTPQDHAFFAMMYKFAEQHSVKYVLTGANYSTECIRNPIEWMYYQTDRTQLRDIHRKHGSRKLEKFPTTSILKHKIYLPYIRGIRVEKPLNLMPYNKDEAVSLLESKIGWQSYPQKHFESRFTRFYEGFWLPRKFGFDTRRVQYSSLILTNQMTRADALARLENSPLDNESAEREFGYIASKLDISEDELWSIFNAPNKSFRDYKSEHRLYSLGATLMKGIGLELGGKR